MHGLISSRGMALAGVAALLQTTMALAQTASPAFDVMAYVVNGNTVLPARDVEEAVYPYLGPDKTVADVEAARKALEKVFQDRGYLSVVVNLPVQKITSGEVTLEVVEAPVNKLRVEGAQYHLPSRIAANVPSLAPGQVPYFPAVQADLAAIQKASPEVQITPLISSSDNGRKIDVNLQVEDQAPFHGSVELNNKQTFNSTAGRIAVSAGYDNLFQRGHSASVTWNYAPWRPADANSLSMNYAIPMGRDDRWQLSWTHSDTDTPTELGGATVTKGDTVGLHWRHELPAYGANRSQDISIGVDLKDNRDANRAVAGFTTESTGLRYPALVMRYNLSLFGEAGEFTNFNAAITAGSEALGQRQVNCRGQVLDQFECKRAGSSAGFQVLKLGWMRRAPLFKTWRLNLNADAQLASGPLASPEQFGAGGVDSVRGYYDYEQVGDQGWTLRAELQTPNRSFGPASLSGLVFWDRAALRLFQAQAGQFPIVQMGSVGLGLRGEGGSGLQVALDVAAPMFDTYKPHDITVNGVTQSQNERTSNAPRWNLSVKQAF